MEATTILTRGGWLPGGHVSSIAERGHLVNTIVEALTPRRL
jgi:hypothetical protein